ncbi:MAG: TSUP family transporter [Rubricoccaceae bacterium]|nr:TSUP family transporter [Rubricoccaceae bacterium]
MEILLLLVAGAVGGFIAGLVGVGGGIIFGPVLFFFFQSQGIEDPILTPLTLGSSLLCTCLAAFSGMIAQRTKEAIDWRTAGISGGFATIVVTLLTLFVTTKAWYSKEEFQVVLSVVLVAVVVRMLLQKDELGNSLSTAGAQQNVGFLALIGAGAGAIAAGAGVGGGVIMVPAFNGLVRLPLKVAAGSSTTAIVLITLVGVVVYALKGLGAGLPPFSVGYVEYRSALLLGIPAMFTAQVGVVVAHRVNVKWVRYSFAVFASSVALKLIWNAIG